MYLIFGASGSIGSYISNYFEEKGKEIQKISSSISSEEFLKVSLDNIENLRKIKKDISGILFCHGYNFNDSLENFYPEEYEKIIDVNITYIIKCLNFLLKENKLNNCKICIISSIWEEFTRKNKLSYTVSKSALSGLTKSLATELAERQILINNVLPGVIENEMTMKTLSLQQLENVKNGTDFKRLVNLNDIASIVYYLVNDNTGITGQSIKVDLGFTNQKRY